ncbi:MAG: PEGA domain-containing protein [Myxococcales bacterium]|nr:MAG: PEGA domain-containing protein [Myxococcales bacterium]
MFRAFCMLMVCSFCVLSVAHAQNPDAKSELAKRAYTKGETLFKAGHYEAAQVQFEAAYAASPNPVVLLSVAKTQEKLENYSGVVQSLERYLKERADAPDAEQVQKRINKIKSRPALYRINSQPDGARIFVDGQAQSHVTPAEVQLTPGEHEIELRADGYEAKHMAVSANFAERRPIAVALKKEAAPVVETNEVKMDEEPVDLMPAVWVAAGVSGAALIAGTVLGILALKEQSDFNDNPSTSSADRGENFALFADLSFGLAAAAGITAFVLFLDHNERHSRKEKADKQTAKLELRPELSTQRAGLSAKFNF